MRHAFSPVITGFFGEGVTLVTLVTLIFNVNAPKTTIVLVQRELEFCRFL